MEIARTLPDLETACSGLRARHGSLGLVPTMGALHDGHLSLLRQAQAAGGATVVSIFVNPLQFGPAEDLTRYPRDEDGDLSLLRTHGCDLVWLPDVATMYPPDDATTIEVAGPARLWEGAARPGHFRGVATVCARLFGQVGADLALFGEKDWQQLQVIRRMVRDLHLPVRIEGAPIIREPDGLALSSRNRFLGQAERLAAPVLFETLRAIAERLRAGAVVDGVIEEGRDRLKAAGFWPDYLALVDGPSMEPIAATQPGARLIAAALLGGVRLLDNVPAGTARISQR